MRHLQNIHPVLQFEWQKQTPVLDQGPHWCVEEWSWLCKAALVLLQHVFGCPMIPTSPIFSCVSFHVYIMCDFNLYWSWQQTQCWPAAGYLHYTLASVTQITQTNLIQRYIEYFFVNVLQLFSVQSWRSGWSKAITASRCESGSCSEFTVQGFRVQRCLSQYLTWKRKSHINEKKTLSSGISFCFTCTLTWHTEKHTASPSPFTPNIETLNLHSFY